MTSAARETDAADETGTATERDETRTAAEPQSARERAQICRQCGTCFSGHPLARYCSPHCRRFAAATRNRAREGVESPDAYRLAADTVEQARSLIQRGYATETAAAELGCTGRAIRNHLRRQGLTARGVRGGTAILLRRYPCRYCGEPAREPHGVCSSAVCRARAWAELPASERTARIRQRDRSHRDSYNQHVETGRRVDVHVLLSGEQAEQLRELAAIRQMSLSALVAEALEDAGMLTP